MRNKFSMFLVAALIMALFFAQGCGDFAKPDEQQATVSKDSIWVTHAKDWTYAKIPPGNTPEKLEHKIIVAGDGYLNIWLTSFRICNIRKGLKKFFGTVYSYISLPIIDNGKAEFQSVTTPRELQKIDAQHLDRIIISNQRLLGPIPYRGGDLSLEIGLCSIKEADLAGPFLDLLGSISKIAGVSFISASLPFVSILDFRNRPQDRHRQA